MLRSFQSIAKSTIQATDGEIGKVEQFLFDDEQWVIRYLVVKTGNWFTGKKVLVSPLAIVGGDPGSGKIHVSLSQTQIKESPDIDTDQPINRQMEAQHADYYRWPYYWRGAGIWGIAPDPAGMLRRPFSLPLPQPQEAGSPPLRLSQEVRGYGIEAMDRRFGHIEDFIIDDTNWSIRYLVIDTVSFWPSKSVILAPQWVDSIHWAEHKLKVNLYEEQIKNGPEYRPDEPINRDYEEKLYDYYGRPRYWKDSPQEPGKYVI